MTNNENFQNLTPEQVKEIAAIKNIADLESFAVKHGIELSASDREAASEFIQSGLQPLDDDELDAAAGGGFSDDNRFFNLTEKDAEIAKQARSDGRPYRLNAYAVNCSCNAKYKYYRKNEYYLLVRAYSDVKCYKCGRTWKKIIGPGIE